MTVVLDLILLKTWSGMDEAMSCLAPASSAVQRSCGVCPLMSPAKVYLACNADVVRCSDQRRELNAQIMRSRYVTQLSPSVESLVMLMRRSSLMMASGAIRGRYLFI